MTAVTMPEVVRALCATDGLRAFVRLTWSVVEARPLVWSWHLDALCEALEAMTRRTSSMDLVVAIPPGCSKSMVTSVLWPAWEWTLEPTRKWIAASYDKDLVLRDARKMRMLVNSSLYQGAWPGVKVDRQDENVPGGASYFVNTALGSRFSTTIKGAATGHHADTHVIDDPVDPQGAAAASGIELAWSVEWYDGTMSTRFTDHTRKGRVLIAQRLHARDLSAHMIDQGARVLCLPMRFEKGHPQRSPVDRRSTEGELLCPARYPEAEVKQLEKQLGPIRAAAQLQQRPGSEEGNLFKGAWFQKRWLELPRYGQFFLSVDCTFKKTEDADCVSMTAWLVHRTYRYLCEEVFDVMSFVETTATLEKFRARWFGIATDKRFGYMPIVPVLIEDAANGPAVVSMLSGRVPGLRLVKPRGGKIARANATTGLFQAGDVWMPARDARYPDGAVGCTWVESYIQRMKDFPRGQYDDSVDSTTQFLIHAAGVPDPEGGWDQLEDRVEDSAYG